MRLGDYTTLLTDDEQKLYAFSRKYGKEEVIVVINRGDHAATFTNELLKKNNYRDVFTKTIAKEASVKPMNVVVLSNR